MSAAMVAWEEKISRGTAIALMNNFTSVAEAIKELVDNPVDYRWGQPLRIDIVVDKKRDLLVVESDGGRGMDALGIQDWLNWGDGESHDASDIGRWHQGGKAACGFLGRHVRLWAKRKDSDEIWFLEDEDWATRTDPKDFGEATPLTLAQHPHTMRGLPTERGHVRVQVTNLAQERRWNLEDLKRALSDTYRCLLENATISIRINEEGIGPLDIPVSTASSPVEVDVSLQDGRKAYGRAWRTKRNELDIPVKSGFRLVHNGRLIKQGEWFGYNYEGKGALNSLVGELHLTRFTPVPNKTDFVERGDAVWEELSKHVIEQIGPLIAELRQGGDEARVSKQEKERVKKVADQLEKVFASLREEAVPSDPPGKNGHKTDQAAVEPAGRRRRRKKGPRKPIQNPRGPNVNPRQPRTPPPEDPVGALARLLEKITGGSKRPPLRVRSWDATERSAWTTEGSQVWLDINKSYHLYESFNGSEPYLAETAIFELCKPREGETMMASMYLDRVNLMLLKWAQVASETN